MPALATEPLEVQRDMRMDGVSFCQSRPTEGFHSHLPLGNYAYCILLRAGSLSFEIDYPHRTAFALEAGDILALSGMAPHALRWGGGRPLRRTPLGREDLGPPDPAAPLDLMIGAIKDEAMALWSLRAGPIHLKPSRTPEIARRIWGAARMLEDEHAEAPSLERNRVVRRLAEIIAINLSRGVAQAQAETSDSDSDIDGRILDALDAFFAEPAAGWTLAKLSRTAGMSRTRFIEGFKQASGGQPPVRIMSRIRLSNAARRLVDDNLSIENAAEDAGYGSAAAFIRAFQREFGETPARWRRRQRAGELRLV